MAEFVTAIRTAEGDKKIDYNALANLPKDMTPKSHVNTHKIGGSDPLWTATDNLAGLMSASDKSKLDAVDLDKIDSINILNSHIWKRRTIQMTINTSNAETKSFKVAHYAVIPGGIYEGQTYGPYQAATQFNDTTIYYADSYTSSVNSSDIVTFTLTNPTSVILTATAADATLLSVVKGKYWYTSSSASSLIYYTPANAANATFTGPTPYQQSTTLVEGDAIYSISAQTLTGVYTVGPWKFVYSDSSTSYPHSGIVDGYEYIYYGDLERRQTSPAFETGYYIGTGTVGENGKSSLTFSFVPRYVKIYYTVGEPERTFTFINPLEGFSLNFDVSAYFVYWRCSWDNETLTWWVDSSEAAAADQANQSGRKYYYVAWG